MIPLNQSCSQNMYCENFYVDKSNEHKDRLVISKEKLKSEITKNNYLVKFKNIPDNKLYTLFIDACRWPKDKDNEKIFDEKEPGYMASMMEAFTWMVESINDPLNSSLILELHDKAISGVTDDKQEEFNNGFRNDGVAFGLKQNSTLSKKGFEELNQRRKNDIYNMSEYNNENLYEICMQETKKTIAVECEEKIEILFKITGYIESKILDEKSAENFSEKIKNSKILKTDKNETSEIVDILKENEIEKENLEKKCNDKTICILKQQIIKTKSTLDLFLNKIKIYKKPSIILKPVRDAINKDGMFISKCVDKIIENYKKSINKSCDSEDAKLSAIIRLCQDLDQLHPFLDGNIRTFGILLFMREMIRLDLNPCCFQDPNCLDCLSVEEIKEKVKEGQKNFLFLSQGS